MKFLNNLFISLTTLTLSLGMVSADEYKEESNCFSFCDFDCQNDWDIELRTAYFYPSSDLERDIYEGARFDVEVQVAKTICENWDVWANFTYLNKIGKSVGLHEKTTLQLFPLSLGAEYVYPWTCSLSLYAGMGINYTWMRIYNDASAGSTHVNKSKWGFTTKTGARYQFTEKVFGDLFLDYLYIPMQLKNVYNIGGVMFGVGLGVHI